VLGLAPDIQEKLEERPLNIEPGDKVVLFTDGVVEAQNATEEEFGMARLTASLERHGGLAPEKVVDAVRRDVTEFMDGNPQYDDITVIAMETE
jgi:sigma-B regulation protein RsbU (phosphoserine phosphatase)